MKYKELFIVFGKKVDFDSALNAGNLNESSIVFIEDTHQIWTQGTLYSCSLTSDEILELLNSKVDKVSGKGLSTNDFTTSEKTKLAGIATGAQVNTVNSVSGKQGDVTLTKNDVGLNEVDNTSDLDKPISSLTQQALDSKANISDLSNVLAEEIIEPPLLEEINTLTREQIKKDLFIDLWNKACKSYGRYNPETLFFELNGLTDITYDEAIEIYNVTTSSPCKCAYVWAKIRTNLPKNAATWASGAKDELYPVSVFYGCDKIEVAWMTLPDRFLYTLDLYNMFTYCHKLHTVIGILHCGNLRTTQEIRWNLTLKLENVKIHALNTTLKIPNAPLLSLESVKYMVDNAANQKEIKIVVHPDVYAKLIDTSNTEWNLVLLDAADKDIIFATEN